MLRRELSLLFSTLLIASACVNDETPPIVVSEGDSGSNVTTDSGSGTDDVGSNNTETDAGTETDTGSQWSEFAELTDVTRRDACSLGGEAIYVAARLPEMFPDAAAFADYSVYNVGAAPRIYQSGDTTSFSFAWANALDSTIHVSAGTAVVSTGATDVESPVYFRLNLSPGVAVTALTLQPASGMQGTEPLYEVTLFTSEGVHKCEARRVNSDQSISQSCEPDTNINNFVTQQSLAPVRQMRTLPVITMDNVFTPWSLDYLTVGNGGESTYRLGAIRSSIRGLETLGFPDIVAIQETPFFERSVLGASSEANRAPYIMALVGEGAEANPTVLTANEMILEYTTEVSEWSLIPDYEATSGKFSFVSSLDLTVPDETLVGPRISPEPSDAYFGYVAVLADGSLGFSTPSGFGDAEFLRWVGPEPIERIWAFDNYAWQQSPGEPIILARTASGALQIIRWDLSDELEVIPNALSGAGVESVEDARGTYLANHDGSIALKVIRGGEPDLAILPLEGVRDFSDFICN